MAIDSSKCMDCLACVVSCQLTNGVPAGSFRNWIKPGPWESGSKVHYQPGNCMQCEKPPCVKVCTVRTTYREADGPVVIDYNWCIGCKMCMGACPYWARRFNLTTPVLPKEEMNPVTFARALAGCNIPSGPRSSVDRAPPS